MDTDLNTYDVEHVCTAHATMTKSEWEAIYREAWSLFYTPKHMKAIMRRAAATGVPMGSLVKMLVSFATTVRLENVHPLQSGVLRLKHRSERRPDRPRENAVVFWTHFIWETFYKNAALLVLIMRMHLWKMVILGNYAAVSYRDQALTPVTDDDDAGLDLMTKTTGAATAIAHVKKIAELTTTMTPKRLASETLLT